MDNIVERKLSKLSRGIGTLSGRLVRETPVYSNESATDFVSTNPVLGLNREMSILICSCQIHGCFVVSSLFLFSQSSRYCDQVLASAMLSTIESGRKSTFMIHIDDTIPELI